VSRRRQTIRQRRVARRRRGGRVNPWGVVGLMLVVALGAVVLGSLLGVSSVAKDLPNLSDLKPVALGQNTRIYDRYGHLLGTIAGDTNRTVVR
jgi:penicillin-binding protein 1A